MKPFRSFPIVLATIVVGLGVYRDQLTESRAQNSVSATVSVNATVAHNNATANVESVRESATDLAGERAQGNDMP